MVGSVKFKAFGKRGEKVTISHAEILDKDGNVVVDKEMSLIEMAAYVGIDVDGLIKGEE